jgi:hypothetical protein
MLGDPHSGSKAWGGAGSGYLQTRENCRQILAHWDFNLRPLSTTERIAATLGPARGLRMCIQFFRPRAMGRIEFSQGYCSPRPV